MKTLRILALMHEDLVPPEDFAGYDEKEVSRWKTEYDVTAALANLGHEVFQLGVRDELLPIRHAVENWKPHIVFNLLEEFKGEAVYDQNVVGYLELLGVPYTGCSPRGMLLARDKALSKQILTYHRIRVPQFSVFPMGKACRRPRRLEFPLFVKSVIEDSSWGISQASIVYDDGKLAERVRFIHETVHTDAIAEQFIAGREIYVGVLGNNRLQVLPPQELVFEKRASETALIATAKAKHDLAYQKKWGIELRSARDLPEGTAGKLLRVAKRIYRCLSLSGYARIDFRVDESGEPYFLEANPNPDIARFEEFSTAAEEAGIGYEALLQKIINLGLRRGA